MKNSLYCCYIYINIFISNAVCSELARREKSSPFFSLFLFGLSERINTFKHAADEMTSCSNPQIKVSKANTLHSLCFIIGFIILRFEAWIASGCPSFWHKGLGLLTICIQTLKVDGSLIIIEKCLRCLEPGWIAGRPPSYLVPSKRSLKKKSWTSNWSHYKSTIQS